MKATRFTLLFLCLLIAGSNHLQGQNWLIGGNTVAGDARLGTNNNFGVIIETNNIERGRILNNGNWGLGTATPAAKLHINQVAGQRPFHVSVANQVKLLVHQNGGTSFGGTASPPVNGVYVNGNVGIGTNAPQGKLHVVGKEIVSTGDGAGFKFRSRGSTSGNDDWAWYANSNIARLWKAGLGDALGITATGSIGLGTVTPGSYRVKVAHGTFGFNIENVATADDWEMWANSGGLSLYANSAFRGNFNPTTGAYTAVSDERVKTEIKPMPSVLEKVRQLKPSSYKLKDTGAGIDTTERFGFMAQDVRKIFPNLVMRHVEKERGLDTYSLDYSAFGIIAIKAIQELERTNREQLEKISALEERLTKLELMIAMMEGVSPNTGSKDLQGMWMEQNHPNPFSKSTSLNFSIPPEMNGQIFIYEMSTGTLVRTIPVQASGQITINAAGLRPGPYTYSLVVNGKVIESKKLIVE